MNAIMVDRILIKDYVLLMLGSPTVSIPMSDNQLDFILDEAEEMTEFVVSKKMSAQCTSFVFSYFMKTIALSLAKMVLGRIRKELGTSQGNNLIIREGEALINEGKRELNHVLKKD